jgi:hypothetical protein
MGKKLQPGAGVRDAMLMIYGQIVKVRNSDFLKNPKVYFI